MTTIPDRVRRGLFLAAAAAGVAAAGILQFRAGRQVVPHPEIVWGVAGGLLAAAAAGLFLLVVLRGDDERPRVQSRAPRPSTNSRTAAATSADAGYTCSAAGNSPSRTSRAYASTASTIASPMVA